MLGFCNIQLHHILDLVIHKVYVLHDEEYKKNDNLIIRGAGPKPRVQYRLVSQAGWCHKLSSITCWPMSQAGWCHKLAVVTHECGHKLARVKSWLVSSAGGVTSRKDGVTHWLESEAHWCHKRAGVTNRVVSQTG